MPFILITEDDEEIREYLSENLQDTGFEVSTAANGEECMNKIAKKIPDILLLDIQMDKMTGIEVLHKLQKKKKQKKYTLLFLQFAL